MLVVVWVGVALGVCVEVFVGDADAVEVAV